MRAYGKAFGACTCFDCGGGPSPEKGRARYAAKKEIEEGLKEFTLNGEQQTACSIYSNAEPCEG